MQLFSIWLCVSIPSSKKILWPAALYPTLSITVRKCEACIVKTLANEWCTEFPYTIESETSPHMWKCIGYLPIILGYPTLVNSAYLILAIVPAEP